METQPLNSLFSATNIQNILRRFDLHNNNCYYQFRSNNSMRYVEFTYLDLASGLSGIVFVAPIRCIMLFVQT